MIDKNILLNMIQQTKVKLPYSDIEVKLRAFLVKEMKLLLMAAENLESRDDKSYIEVISQILKNCIIEPTDIDIDNLPIFEIELLYVKLWMLSKGESIVPVTFRCMNEVEKSNVSESGEVTNYKAACDTEIKTRINLNVAKLSDAIENKIALSDGISVTMRYPTLNESLYFDLEKEKDIFNLIVRCIASIEVQDEVNVVGKDISEDELSELVEFMTPASLEKMTQFVDSIPQMEINLALKCPCCGHEEPIVLKGIEDFFL